MKKRWVYSIAITLLALSVAIVVWLGSFNPGPLPKPTNPNETLVFWAGYCMIFLLMLALMWYLFREGAKLYLDRQSHREGSRIKSKLVVGAVTLSCLPVFFMSVFNFMIMNRNLASWIRGPEDKQIDLFKGVSGMLSKEMQDETRAQAALLAAQPEIHQLLSAGVRTPGFLQQFCQQWELESASITPAAGSFPIDSWGPRPAAKDDGRTVVADARVMEGEKTAGTVYVSARIPQDAAASEQIIRTSSKKWEDLRSLWKSERSFYTLMMALITVIVLCISTWIAFLLAKQISIPITALLDAASQVRKGNLTHRVDVRAADELGSLVRGFNQMTQELEANARELDRRRRFTEAILESIPTGVISITADGSIKRVNKALSKIFPPQQVEQATRLEDLFSREDTAEIKYLMKRARRTGVASRQLDMRTAKRKLNIAVTISALEEKLTSGFVIVLEDTSELLRAQKSAAWHEVARRVAHEIKNPLTPIGLSAERIGRQLDKLELPPHTARILRECSGIISKSVESVKTLVDEFSQFARFPSAQPVRCDLNEVVEEALAIFKDRLEGISMRTSLAPDLPPVNVDREQFHRVVVNLVDNAAEAMQDSLVKELYVTTQHGAAETVELVVADTGAGVSSDDKEKLFLPYFSTKNRGTGLGLAIVSHIVAEHNAHIRVEDNQPVGARFTVEIPAFLEADQPEMPRPAAAKV
ncbi:Multi-sensor signal transduction histidine kinase [Candidatus Sulfopaludibacter sp. SbA3]|nr:Multi-sensor signal transduction histidine kinase [Candidatus Sulfopaludibacter sp. SbA3]